MCTFSAVHYFTFISRYVAVRLRGRRHEFFVGPTSEPMDMLILGIPLRVAGYLVCYTLKAFQLVSGPTGPSFIGG